MAATITVGLDVLPAQEFLDQTEDRLQDLTPLMDQIGALVEQSTRDRLEDTNVTPEGVAWPLSLRAKQDGGKTLYNTGRLAASLTHVATRNTAEVGSNLIYAGVHQTGMVILPKTADGLAFQLPNGDFVVVDKVTIPARPYLGLSNEDEDDIADLANTYFEGDAR